MHNDCANESQNNADDKSSMLSQKDKIKLYKTLSDSNQGVFFIALCSYLHVTSAVIESTEMIVVLVLLLFATGRSNRQIDLIVSAKHKLAITLSGQFVLEFYLCFLTINRVTTAVSLFTSTQTKAKRDGI